ncbi:MAG TPA: YceD family protein [Steroidobacteraceae bacterium]|jgi:uncharacterized protein|nr:YceD family protein [Steroidobacteraceae bacterium]
MPGGPSKLRDVRKLSDARAILDLDIPLAELPGLPVELIVGGGPLRVQVQFGREQGFMVAEVALRGELALTCQRCMGPMPWQVDVSSPVLLIESEAQADGAPAERESYLAAEGRVSLAGLAAEELLLALPIVPLHADGAECDETGVAATAEPVAAEQGTARPFADLRALLEQGAKRKE